MSKYYTPKRVTNLFLKDSKVPFKLSRTKLELFIDCPRCFYLDRRLGVGRPPGFPFNLNSAVDKLLKKEFDIHRAQQAAHPLISQYNIDARPVEHESLNVWRENFHGVQALHKKTNLLIFGAIDDLWINSKNEYIVVDYKATSKDEVIEKLDKDWHDGYKRQMEIYQWLLRQNGLKVCDTGYFVYCNGKTDKEAFDKKLEFEITLIPHKGNCSWVDEKIADAYKCMMSDEIPKASKNCDYCNFVENVRSALRTSFEARPLF